MLKKSNGSTVAQFIHDARIQCYITIAIRKTTKTNGGFFRIAFWHPHARLHSI